AASTGTLRAGFPVHTTVELHSLRQHYAWPGVGRQLPAPQIFPGLSARYQEAARGPAEAPCLTIPEMQDIETLRHHELPDRQQLSRMRSLEHLKDAQDRD